MNETLEDARQAFEQFKQASSETTIARAEQKCRLATALAQAETLERIAKALEAIYKYGVE